MLESCDIFEETDKSIQKKLDKKLRELTENWYSNVYACLAEKYVKIHGLNVHVQIKALFSMLVVLLEKCEDVTPFFKREHTPCPMSRFKRKTMSC